MSTDDAFEPATVGLLGILKIMLRWSFVIAPLAALTVWIALSQGAKIEPEYTASASMLLVGPNEVIIENFETGATSIEEVNPLRGIGGTLGTVARVAELAANDAAFAEALFNDGFTSNYVVFVDGRNPIIGIEAFDTDPELAVATVERITTEVVTDLAELQDELDAPESDRITTSLISSGLAGGPDYSARTRFALAVVAVGFALSAASAFVLEGIRHLLVRRRSRRREPDPKPVPQTSVLTELDTSAGPDRGPATAGDAERSRAVAAVHLIVGDIDRAREIVADATATLSTSDAAGGASVTERLYHDAVTRALSEPAAPTSPEPGSPLWSEVLDMTPRKRAVLALTSIAGFTNEQIAATLQLDRAMIDDYQAEIEEALDSVDASSEVSTSDQAGAADVPSIAPPAPAPETGETAPGTGAKANGSDRSNKSKRAKSPDGSARTTKKSPPLVGAGGPSTKGVAPGRGRNRR